MSGSDGSAVFEQHAHGFGFAAIGHPYKRCLPVLGVGFAGEALGKGAVECGRIACQNIGDAIESVEIE